MQTYKTAATARRGAFRAKLNPNDFTVHQNSDGLWLIKTSEPLQEPLPTEPSPAEPAPSVEAKTPKSKPTKTKVPQARTTKAKTTRQSVSIADSPVATVWNWLAQGDNAKLKRADAIAALVQLGIASGTASTQRFKFLDASPAERAARAERD